MISNERALFYNIVGGIILVWLIAAVLIGPTWLDRAGPAVILGLIFGSLAIAYITNWRRAKKLAIKRSVDR
ncbi:MAG TPA: hypothetical protein PK808_08625 [Polymorphobacter sp.]|nr:hypothetical protein [Polymorphobacter sp.]